jgi:hypothetical protein
MNNPQFSISYNGHRTAVTCLADNIFMVQITPMPFHIQYLLNDEGIGYWVEVEDSRETALSADLGQLIAQEHFT